MWQNNILGEGGGSSACGEDEEWSEHMKSCRAEEALEDGDVFLLEPALPARASDDGFAPGDGTRGLEDPLDDCLGFRRAEKGARLGRLGA